MFTIIIIDFNSYSKTISYINDFTSKVNYSKISFVVVDNSNNEENFKILDSFYTNNGQTLSRKINICEYRINKLVDKISSFIYKYHNKVVEITIVKNKGNYGFAKGNNVGACIADKLYAPKYIIFSNNDITIDEKFNDLSVFKRYFDNREIALIGPEVVGLDGKNQSPHKKLKITKRWIVPNLLWPIPAIANKLLNKNIKIENDILQVKDNKFVYRIIGAFMVFKTEIFFEIGMFDENTFLYAEELIIAEKLIKYKYKTYYITDFKLIHEEGYTFNKSYTNLKKIQQMFNSEMYYYKEYISINKFTELLAKLAFKSFVLKKKLLRI